MYNVFEVEKSRVWRIAYFIREEAMHMTIENIYLFFIYILFFYFILVTAIAIALSVGLMLAIRKLNKQKNTPLSGQ